VIAFRRADYDTPLRTEPASRPGRFHRGTESQPTQYLCLHPLGPLAELMRGSDLRRPEQVRAVAARTWALEIDLTGLPEIGFANAVRFGAVAADLVADDYEPCWRLADLLRSDHSGAIVPSAALPGTSNVVLFGAHVAAPYLVTRIGTVDVPASITAHGGRPIASLLGRVCFHGSANPALRAWEAGERYSFAEPDWSLAAAG
jgi:hypothetical protein